MSEELAKATVIIRPDTTGFREDLRAKLDAATAEEKAKIHLEVDTHSAATDLRDLEGVAASAASALGGAGGAGGSAGGGLSGALSSAGSSAQGLAGSISPLIAAGVALSPLLAPIGGSLVTGAVALGSAFTVAGLAVGGFAAVAMPLLSDATTANQKLLAAQVAVNDATTSKAREQALDKQAALITQLGAPTIALGQAMNDLQQSWHQFAEGFQPQVLELFQTAASSLAKILPEITPVIAAGAIAVNMVAKEFVAALESPAGQQFFKWVATEAGPIILTFADIFAKFGAGVIGIFEAFTPLTNMFVAGLDNAAASFAKWGTDLAGTSGFQQFIEYMKANGPLLLNLLSEIIKFAFDLIVALAPIAPYMIDVLSAIVKLADWLVTGLGTNIQQAIELIVHGFGDAANFIASFVQGVGNGFGDILHGAVDAFSWVPGLGDGLKSAAADFDSFRDTAVGDLHAVAAAAAGFGAVASLSLSSPGVQGRGRGALASGGGSSSGFADNTSSSLSSMFAQFNSLFANFKPGTGSAPSDLTGVPGGSVGSPAASAATVNLAAAFAALQATSIGAALAQGVATGINPIAGTLSTLTSNLKGATQTIAQDLTSMFATAMSYGQAAQKSLGVNIVTGLPAMGTVSNAYTDPNTLLTTLTPQSSILAGLQSVLGTDKSFIGDIGAATKLGLAQSLIQQFVAAGPSSLPQLDALVHGSPGDIKSINSTYGAISQQATLFGQAQAQTAYLAQLVGIEQQLLVAAKQTPSGVAAAIARPAAAGVRTAVLRPAPGAAASSLPRRFN